MTDETKPIIWCEDDGRSFYADMSQVTSARDEISLLFGVSQTPDSNTGELRVRLKERIVLSPLVAKHFSLVLNSVLKKFESDIKGKRTDRTTENGESVDERPLFPINGENEKVNSLLRSLSKLNLKYGLERSLKISHHKINDNRFLLGFSKDEIQEDAHGKIKGICQQLHMPDVFFKPLKQGLDHANYIHFGCEASGTSCMYKVYLEFWEKIKAEMQRKNERPDQVLLHLGFKWDAMDSKIYALTRYTWHPWITVEDILIRIKQILDPEDHQMPINIVSNITKLAANKIPHHDFLYLEVTEEDNPRRSFDINMYRANLTMGQLKPFMEAILRHYSIPEEKFKGLYESIKSEELGHISGGIDREGKDFLTLYYGVKGAGIKVRQSNIRGDFYPTKTIKSGKNEKKGNYLIEQVKTLNVKVAFERSFKFLPNMILPHRFLIAFKKDDINGHADDRILNICRQINMPDDDVHTFQKNLEAATIVAFGYERQQQNSIYKAYLEFGGGFEAAYSANPDHPLPFIIHLGFKWDVSNSENRAIARYTCFPAIDMDTISEKIAKILHDADNTNSLEIAKGVVKLAATRIDPRTMLYFEGAEEDNPRKSYDINLYQAKLHMEMLEPWLYKMSRTCAIPDADFNPIYERVKQHRFGHLTGGIDRRGKNFFTVYFMEP